jgi:hypothetical protein
MDCILHEQKKMHVYVTEVKYLKQVFYDVVNIIFCNQKSETEEIIMNNWIESGNYLWCRAQKVHTAYGIPTF